MRVCGEPGAVGVGRALGPCRCGGRYADRADPLMGVTLAVNRLRECSNSMNQLRIVCTNRFLGEVPINGND